MLIEDIRLPKAQSGDLLAILTTGAYHYSMAGHYNRNPIPPVVLVRDGRSDYMVKPESYERIMELDTYPVWIKKR